jgi:hypothetical protein
MNTECNEEYLNSKKPAAEVPLQAFYNIFKLNLL